MTTPNITIPRSNTILLISCIRCDYQAPVHSHVMLRGTEYICSNCGSSIEILPNHTVPMVKMRVSSREGSADFEVTARTDSTWVFLDDDEKSILDVIDYDSDRAVAIITGSMIENRLKQAICIRSKRRKDIEDRLFKPSGPLGSFSAKIDLSYMYGLISDAAYQDLVVFKDIRNLFAHNLSIKDFRSRRIIDKANNLRLVDTLVAEYKPSPDKDGKLVNFGNNDQPAIRVRHAAQRRKRARERYLMTAQIFTVKFAAVNHKNYPLPFV